MPVFNEITPPIIVALGGGMGSFVQNRCFTASPSPQTPYKPKKSRKSSVPCQRIFKSPIFSHPCASRASANQPLGNHPPATRNQTPLGGGLASFVQNQLRPATHSSQIPYEPKRSQKSPVPCQQILKTSSSAIPARASRGADQPLRKRPTRHPQSNPRGGGVWLRLFKINSTLQLPHPKSLTNRKNRKNHPFRVGKFSKTWFSPHPFRPTAPPTSEFHL